MKNIGKLANRYAKALLNATGGTAGDTKVMFGIADELREFAQLWQDNKQLAFFILNPSYPKQQRLNALLKIVETAGMSVTAINFLKVVFEHNRISAVAEIATAYRTRVEKLADMVRVKIETAREVGADERYEYESKLRGKISGHLIFEWDVQEDLLGGMIISYSGKVFDGSIKGRFEKLEEKMLGY